MEGLNRFFLPLLQEFLPLLIFQTVPGKQKALVPGLTSFFLSPILEGGLEGIEDGNCG